VNVDADLFARAARTAPGGVHSPVRAFQSVGGTPIFMASADGAWLHAVDGRRFIDVCQSFGPLILGHRHPTVRAAVHAAVDDGWSYGTAEPYSLALAEWIIDRVPWIERIRFVSSGTEAVMSVVRVARAATGRSRILKFEGCYHGHADGFLVKAGSGLAGASAASSAGLPPDITTQTIVVPLDDEDAFDAALHQNGQDLAAVVLEPVPANYGLLPQRRDWMAHVVERCRANGTLVVFDEVITGFRSGLTGAAGHYGLVPDLVTFGKVIGGGFPVGAYAGREDLLRLVAPEGPVYQAGTLSANPIGMRAGLATLQEMERLDGWQVLEQRAGAFVDSLERGLRSADPSLSVVRHGSAFWIVAGATGHAVRRPDQIPADHARWFSRFFHAALGRGVYLPPSGYEVGFLSMAHDDALLARTAEALSAAAADVRG
jgi:glutamate-1-semialdehyde 2,1-aminomutase